MGRRIPPGEGISLSRELEVMRASDPLLDPVTRGDRTPRTAEREFGADAWGASHQRAGCLRYCGAEPVCSLPLVGGPDFVIAMFGRAGEEFSDDRLRLLTTIRPVVSGVVRPRRSPTAATAGRGAAADGP